MPIYIGNTNISNLYIGNTPITKVYVGTTLVFDKSQPTPVQPIYIIQNGADWQGHTSWDYKIVGGNTMTQTTPMSHIYSRSDSVYTRYAILSQGAISIPSGLTTLHVEARRDIYGIEGYGFGLVPSTVTTSSLTFNTSTLCTNAGAIGHSNISSAMKTTLQTFDLDISGFDPSIQYKFYICGYKGGAARRVDFFTPTMWID